MAVQTAKSVTLDGREVPFHIKTIKDATGTTTCTLDSLDPIATLSGTFDIRATNSDFGLLIPATEQAQVTINGQPLDMAPLNQKNGIIHIVWSSLLTTGTNTLEITRRPMVSSVKTWEGTALFALTDFESFHPGAAFRQAADGPGLKNSQPPTANQQLWDALHYDLYIEPDMDAPVLSDFYDRSHITSAALTMTAQNISGLPLSEVELNFARNTDANSGNSPTGIIIDAVDNGDINSQLTYVTSGNFITVYLATPVAPGETFQVRVTYSGYPDTNWSEAYNQIAQAYNGRVNGSGQRVVYTASQPFGGRRWFPSKDVPEDKASSTTIRIALDSSSSYKGEANGLLKEIVPGPEPGLQTFVWENKHPISTYLMAFYAADYNYSTATYTGLDGITQMPISHAILGGENTNGAAGTAIVMETFADIYGEYPFIDQRYATASWGITFGIEHQTISGMPWNSTDGVGNGLTRRNIHELAHQWWGDSLTYKTFDELWLGEGFATHAEALFEEFKPGGTRAGYHGQMNTWRSGVLSAGNVPLVGDAAESILNSNVYYRRGAWVLHMLRGILGDEDFFNGLKLAQTTHRHSTLDSNDFQAIMETASGRNLDNFFTQWLYRNNAPSAPTFPTYGFSGHVTEAGGQYTVNIRTRQLQGGTIPFDMPLRYRISDGVDYHDVLVENYAFDETVAVVTGTTRPLTVELDPELWLLRNNHGLSIKTVGLPSATVGVFYSTAIESGGGSGNYSATGLPPGILLSTGGVFSGTPTTAGVYIVNVTRGSISSSLRLEVNTGTPIPPPPAIVFNEVYVEHPDGADAGEYIELLNKSGSAVNLEGWTINLVDGGSGAIYQSIVFPPATTIAAGQHFVIGNSATIHTYFPGVVDYNFNLDNVIREDARDGMVLRSADNQIVDSFSVRADATFVTSGEGFASSLEGGVARVRSGAISNLPAVVGRLPDGTDTNVNLLDFAQIPPSPGSANTGIALPFSDDFNGSIRPEWIASFEGLRTATAGALGKPATVASGSLPGDDTFLEIYDSTGGGDANYLPGDWNQFNVEGMIYIPADNANAWSVGVGVGTRHESAWFSSFGGYGIESGFYLEYQNGNGVNLKGVPNHPHTLRFMAVNGAASVGFGPTGTAVTTLGETGDVVKGAWNKFRIVFDRPNNLLHASIGEVEVYEGPFPVGNYPTSGGFAVGFRENHSGNPSAANIEGTWVDSILINNDVDVPVALSHFELN